MKKIRSQIVLAGTFVSTLVAQHWASKILSYKDVQKEAAAQALRDTHLPPAGREMRNELKILGQRLLEQGKKLEALEEKKVQESDASIIAENLKIGEEHIKEAQELLNSGDTSDPIIQAAMSKLSEGRISYDQAMDKVNEIIGPDKFLPDLTSLYEYLDSLSLLQESAFFHIIVLTVILTCILNITSVFFGNEIISYFKLEEKYPKLAFFFKVRNQFQRYYLIFTLIVMVWLCFGALFLNLLILL